MGGKNMKNGIFCLMALFVWQACSVEDKGNYNYTSLNGVTVTFVAEEENQKVEKGVDTLKISPTIAGDIYGENDENYEYTWYFCSGEGHRHTVVGKGKNLEWPVSFKPGNYVLYLQVDDKSTGLQWIKSTGVTVFSELTQGWMLLGETADREVCLDMLVQKPDNSLVLIENIFDNSQLHLKGARGLIFTGYRATGKAPKHLWLRTEEKDLKLTWGNNFSPVGEFYETVVVEEMDVSRETPRICDMFPQQSGVLTNTMRNYSNRGIVTDSAIYMTVIGSDGSEMYVNPMNRYNAFGKEFFKPYPMAFVLLGARITGNLYPLFYDMDAERFVQPCAVYGSSATYCKSLVDGARDPFPWNQYKRTIVYGENLRNSTSDYACNCVALMKDTEGEDINYYIYVFRPGSRSNFPSMLNLPSKVNAYTIDKSVAVNFDQATHYTFMSNANVLLYTVGSTLYAYNYSYKTLTSMDMGSEISYIGADAVLSQAYFWMGTYDGQKGELKLMRLSGQMTPELSHEEDACWPLNMKLTDVEWKYGEDPAEDEPEEGEGQ